GDAKGARAAREKALAIDGSDLQLRRALAWEDGGEVLDDMKRDGDAVVARYRANPMPENSAGVYVLDSSAVQLNPDGSTVERTHLIARVVDQRGVSRLAEVKLPAGAEVLRMRTIKKNGRVLEPEHLGEKDGISLPGVEVGDLIEYEYLSSSGRRPPSMPGFASPKFYFQVADAEVFHSIFEVRAPAGSGLEVDTHNMPGAKPVIEGGRERVVLERSRIAPLVPEPGQPGNDELVPWVQVGTGAGTEALLASYGDLLIDRHRPNLEIERFAREAAAGKTGEDAVRAVYERVMQEVKGKESAGSPAAATLMQGRGSRLMLLRSALTVLGIPTRQALARPFNADPAAYRFPEGDLYAYPLLVVNLPGRAPLFLDPSVRFAPFGELPLSVQDCEAALLPDVGGKLELVRT
ncbi:MAG: DUF3857 domain-containing protein, partial [Myxococcales bacterium]